MDVPKDYNRRDKVIKRRNLKELEQTIRRHCLHRIVMNDGVEMEQLLHKVCLATYVKAYAGFMFQMDTERVKGTTIFARPVDSKQQYLQIIGYRINLPEEAFYDTQN